MEKWAVLPYNVGKIKGRYLVTTFLGGWSILEEAEFKRLHSFDIEEAAPLFKRLREDGIVIDEQNLETLIGDCRRLHTNWFCDPGLHIAVVTDRCNFGCLYCQTKRKKDQMNLEVATKVLEFMYCARNPKIRLELQGGEPLLNWETVKYLIRYAKEFNEIEKKDLVLSLVTNMSLLDDEKIDFLINHDVEVCTSLDGPPEVHDQNRVFKNGRGTYKVVVEGMERLKAEYKKRGLKKKVLALPTITKQSLPYFKEIIDEYINRGIDSIRLRPVNRLGSAEGMWKRIGYTPEEFNHFWQKSLDYILELNKKGIRVQEDMATIILRKILKKQDPMYVDLESPCGAGRTLLTYSPNGDVYTCDEARMIGRDLFKMGNVLKDKYEEVMKSPNLFYTCQASLLDLWDYNSPFSNWSGTCPVFNFYEQGTTVVKIAQSPKQKIQKYQFSYIFDKIANDPEALKIFEKWVEE